ncbi:uncharacterized protein LOC101243252 [Ciona intestinalis]
MKVLCFFALLKAVVAVNYISLGCWRDTSDRAIPTLEGTTPILDNNYRNRINPIRKCSEAALALGHRVFAVQHSGWCASSSDAENTYKIYGEATNCKNGEGGSAANDVYEISYENAQKYSSSYTREIYVTNENMQLQVEYRICMNALPYKATVTVSPVPPHPPQSFNVKILEINKTNILIELQPIGTNIIGWVTVDIAWVVYVYF